MEHSTHYAVLGVHPGANLKAIRSSFRQKAKLLHPDVPSGDARFFIRMSEAYEVLSDPSRREAYDRSRRRSSTRSRRWWQGAGRTGPFGRAAPSRPAQDRWKGAPTGAGPDQPSSRSANRPPPVIMTRVMSMAVPRSGKLKIRGVTGDIRIATTTHENLWETTRRKFEATDSARLARHVIQVRVSGLTHHVRHMRIRPTDFGAEVRCMAHEGTANKKDKAAGPASPRTKPQLSLEITVPEEMEIDLNDVSGAILLGNMKGKLAAKVLGGIIRIGQVGDLNLHLQGNSCAFIAKAQGNVDLMSSDGSRIFLGGAVHRLRAVLEHQASAELATTIDILQTQVFDQASLNVKKSVGEAHCDAQGSAQIRLFQVKTHLDVYRSHSARIDVLHDRQGGFASAPLPTTPRNANGNNSDEVFAMDS